jgi:hypothetical protein
MAFFLFLSIWAFKGSGFSVQGCVDEQQQNFSSLYGRIFRFYDPTIRLMRLLTAELQNRNYKVLIPVRSVQS